VVRNISFMLTTDQVRRRIKTVTRRVGWRNAKPGQLLSGEEKGMGLKSGEKVKRLATIRVVSATLEPLRRLVDDPDYGFAEVVKEGFGDHPTLCLPSEFVQFFCGSHRGCTPETEVTRIEFEYVD
jgi:hypothetical protein